MCEKAGEKRVLGLQQRLLAEVVVERMSGWEMWVFWRMDVDLRCLVRDDVGHGAVGPYQSVYQDVDRQWNWDSKTIRACEGVGRFWEDVGEKWDGDCRVLACLNAH